MRCAGFDVPELAEMAVWITSMISSAGACERNWSTYDFIHSKKRNRLTAQRASDLVYVFTNLRMVKKFGEPKAFKTWLRNFEVEREPESEDEEEGVDPMLDSFSSSDEEE